MYHSQSTCQHKPWQGFDSVMVDGSEFPFKENISYTKFISSLAHAKGMLVEAELGRLSGTEDDLTVENYEARMTDIKQVFFICFLFIYYYLFISLQLVKHSITI